MVRTPGSVRTTTQRCPVVTRPSSKVVRITLKDSKAPSDVQIPSAPPTKPKPFVWLSGRAALHENRQNIRLAQRWHSERRIWLQFDDVDALGMFKSGARGYL